MQIESRYPIKYPYASEEFHKSLKKELDQSSEIPKFEEYGNSQNRKSKQLDTVKQSVLDNSSFANPALLDKFLTFLDTIFSFGSDRVLENNLGKKLSDKIENHLDEIFKVSDIEVGTEILDENGTGKDTDIQGSPTEQPTTLTEEQKLHGKGLVMNFLRDYILERNFLQLAHENNITDASGANWTSSSVSIVGNHTKAVNSDSYQEPKPSSRILGLVADGVSYCPNPVDKEEIKRIKAEGEDDFILEGQEDPLKKQIDDFNKKDLNSYGSHYFSKLLSQSVNDFVLPPSIIINENNSALTDKDAINTAQKIIKNPNIFWDEILYRVINDVDSDSIDRNFFEAIANYLQQNPIEDSYPDLDKALRDKTVQQLLVAALPLSRFNLDAIGENFAKIFDEKDKSITAASHISYAMDLGDKIALVRVGDSPIKALDKDGNVIDSCDNYSLVNHSSDNLNKITGDISIEIDRTESQDQKAKIEIASRIVIDLVDKAKVAYITIASDGISQKENFHQTLDSIFKHQNNLSSKEVINKALELSTDRDDRTMVVLRKNS